MSLPPLQLQPVSTSHYFISGDVTIQDGVAIAPGVLLQAAPNSRIVLKAGACIGIGAVLHAYQGVMEIGEGANIGAEVLLVGQVKIGANACVGPATTIINSTVAWGAVVPPGALIGDPGYTNGDLKVIQTAPLPTTSTATTAAASPTATTPTMPTEMVPQSPGGTVTQPSAVNVYGQVYVNQMLAQLFPNKPPQSEPPPPPPSLADDPWDD